MTRKKPVMISFSVTGESRVCCHGRVRCEFFCIAMSQLAAMSPTSNRLGPKR